MTTNKANHETYVHVDLCLIPIKKQVHIIWLSKVIKNRRELAKKTGVNELYIEHILATNDSILKRWKKGIQEKSKKLDNINENDEHDGINALLLEWLRRSKNINRNTLERQAEILKDFFNLPNYRIKITENEFYRKLPENSESYCNRYVDIFKLLKERGEQILKYETYIKFIKIMGEKGIGAQNSSRLLLLKKKTYEEREEINNDQNDDLILIEKPIECIDVTDDNECDILDQNQSYDISKIKEEPISNIELGEIEIKSETFGNANVVAITGTKLENISDENINIKLEVEEFMDIVDQKPVVNEIQEFKVEFEENGNWIEPTTIKLETQTKETNKNNALKEIEATDNVHNGDDGFNSDNEIEVIYEIEDSDEDMQKELQQIIDNSRKNNKNGNKKMDISNSNSEQEEDNENFTLLEIMSEVDEEISNDSTICGHSDKKTEKRKRPETHTDVPIDINLTSTSSGAAAISSKTIPAKAARLELNDNPNVTLTSSVRAALAKQIPAKATGVELKNYPNNPKLPSKSSTVSSIPVRTTAPHLYLKNYQKNPNLPSTSSSAAASSQPVPTKAHCLEKNNDLNNPKLPLTSSRAAASSKPVPTKARDFIINKHPNDQNLPSTSSSSTSKKFDPDIISNSAPNIPKLSLTSSHSAASSKPVPRSKKFDPDILSNSTQNYPKLPTTSSKPAPQKPRGFIINKDPNDPNLPSTSKQFDPDTLSNSTPNYPKSKKFDPDRLKSFVATATNLANKSSSESDSETSNQQIILENNVDAIRYLQHIKNYLLSQNDEVAVRLLLNLQMSFINLYKLGS